jgi:hypothetical protein
MRSIPRACWTALAALPLFAAGACGGDDGATPDPGVDAGSGMTDGSVAIDADSPRDGAVDGDPTTTEPWTSFASGTTADLHAVWGPSASDIWAVGDVGTITHFDGTTWKTVESAIEAKLTSVHGTSASDVWAVGEDGAVIHFDGTAWSPRKTGLSYEDFNCVWAVDPSDVWAVGGSVFGSEGTIAHFDGTSWSAKFSGRGYGGVWASGKNDVWIVGGRTMAGEDGVLLHKTTGDFESLASGQLQFLTAVMGSSPTEIWIVGGNLNTATTVTGDGTPLSWKGLDHRPGSMLTDVWTRGSDVWAVGGSGATNILHLRKGSGAGWDELTPPDGGPAVNAVWGTDDGSVWFVGKGGSVRRHRP